MISKLESFTETFGFCSQTDTKYILLTKFSEGQASCWIVTGAKCEALLSLMIDIEIPTSLRVKRPLRSSWRGQTGIEISDEEKDGGTLAFTW